MLPASFAISAIYLGTLAVTERACARSRREMLFLNAAAVVLVLLAVVAHTQGRLPQ